MIHHKVKCDFTVISGPGNHTVENTGTRVRTRKGETFTNEPLGFDEVADTIKTVITRGGNRNAWDQRRVLEI